MDYRKVNGIFFTILLAISILMLLPGNNAKAYYGGYGLYGGYGGYYGGYGLGGLYGGYGGYYGGYGGLYGVYGGLYGGYGGLYGGYGGYYGGLYGGYGGFLDLGLSNLLNPLGYYSYGGMYNLLNNFDPLSDPLLGLGMFSFSFL